MKPPSSFCTHSYIAYQDVIRDLLLQSHTQPKRASRPVASILNISWLSGEYIPIHSVPLTFWASHTVLQPFSSQCHLSLSAFDLSLVSNCVFALLLWYIPHGYWPSCVTSLLNLTLFFLVLYSYLNRMKERSSLLSCKPSAHSTSSGLVEIFLPLTLEP